VHYISLFCSFRDIKYLITPLFIFFEITGPFKDELTFKMVKGLKQPKGTNLYGFYVCKYIRWFTSELRARDLDFHIRKQYSQFDFITINCVEFYSTYIYPY
jgi:hypothetical protein